MTNTTNAVVYCRISTSKIEQKTSLEHQRTLFLKTIQKNGETLFDIYADEGDTGTMLDNRDEFERMLYDAGLNIYRHTYDGKTITNFVASKRTPKFNKIYIKNTSRFARNTLSKQIINELRKKNVSIFFLEQNIDTSNNNSIILDFHQMLDEQESRDKSKKVITGLKQSAENNVIKTNTRIYGYKYYPINKYDRDNYYSNRLVPIESEAKIVKLIFELYAQGYGIRKIVKELEKQKVLTREGKPFGKSSIGKILDNEKYAGKNQHFKWTQGYVFEKHSVRKNEEYQVKDCERIEPIVSVELFNKCRKIRQANTENMRGKNTTSSMFCKRIKCFECGANFNADNVDGVRVYRCPTRKFKGVEACSNRSITERACIEFVSSETTKKAVLDHIKQKIQNMQQHIRENQHIVNLFNDPKSQKALEDAQKLAINDEIEKQTRELSIVFTRLRTKEISQAEHNILVEPIIKRINELNEQLDNIKSNNFKTIQEIENEEFEIEVFKTIIKKINKNKDYITNHIYILVDDRKLFINMEDTIKSLIHDAS